MPSPHHSQILPLVSVYASISADTIYVYRTIILTKTAHTPAFLLHIAISATGVQVLVSGLYDSTLFLTRGPSWPPTAYKLPSKTPTPTK